jgi:hypothetical protein
MKGKLAATVLAAAIGAIATAPAFADPSFGPGNSGSNGNQQCTPPGADQRPEPVQVAGTRA